MLDIRRAVEFISEDEKAGTKIAIGSLLLAIPLVNVAMVGYEVEVARRVVRAESQPLPDWNDLGGLFGAGAWLALARLVHWLPMIAVMFTGWLVGFAFLLQIAQSPRQQPASDIGPAVIVVGSCLIGALVAYSFLLGFLDPAILAEYARRGTFAACFDVAAIFRFIRRDPGRYVLAWLAVSGLGLIVVAAIRVVVLALGLIPCVGSLAVTLVGGLGGFIMRTFNSHLAGQLLRAGANPVLPKES